MRWILGMIIMIYTTVAVARPLEPHEVPSEVYLDRSGISELVVYNTFYGAFEGFTLGLTLFDEDGERILGTTLLGTTAGVFLPLYLTKDKPVYMSQAMTYNLASRWGIYNGLMLPYLFDDSVSDRAFTGSASLLSLASLITSIYLYPEHRLTPGQVSALGSGLQFGIITGVAGLVLTHGLWENSSEEAQARIVASTLIVGGNAGLLLAYQNRDIFDIDRRRVLWVDSGGMLGILGGLGLGMLFAGDSEFSAEIISGSALAGMIGGLIAGYTLSEPLDEYKRESDAGKESIASLYGPSFRIIPTGVDSQGKNTFAYGFDILNGQW